MIALSSRVVTCISVLTILQQANAQDTTAFMRMRTSGGNYAPIGQAATATSIATYPDGWDPCLNMEKIEEYWYNAGNNIVNSFLITTGTGAVARDSVSGTYVGPPTVGACPCMTLPPPESDETASWQTASQVLPAVAPAADTVLQPTIGINALHEGTYNLSLEASDPEVDVSIEAGATSESITASVPFTEPFDPDSIDESAGPVRFALVSLDTTATPIGTVKGISGSIDVAGQAAFSGYENTGDAEVEVSIKVLADGGEIAVVEISEGMASCMWMSGGEERFAFSMFSLTDSPGITVNFDGAATVSDQNDPEAAVEVEFKSWLRIGEEIGNGWAGVEGKTCPFEGYSGTGSADLSFGVIVNIENP